jgi:hypothetical protein
MIYMPIELLLWSIFVTGVSCDRNKLLKYKSFLRSELSHLKQIDLINVG